MVWRTLAADDALDPLNLVQFMAVRLAPAPESSSADVPESLLTAAQVARIVGVSTKRVYELGIPAVRISERSLRWRPRTVEIWIAQHEGLSAE